MKNNILLYFICTLALVIILTVNGFCNSVNDGVKKMDIPFEKLKLENANKIIIESLEYSGQKYKKNTITNKKLITKIIEEMRDCELIDEKIYGILLGHNHILTFYEDETEIVKLKFYFEKDNPDTVFFRYYIDPQKVEGRIMNEYHAKDNKLFQLLCPLVGWNCNEIGDTDEKAIPE